MTALEALSDALADEKRLRRSTEAHLEQERWRRHQAEQQCDALHRLIAEQTRLIEELGSRPASEVAS